MRILFLTLALTFAIVGHAQAIGLSEVREMLRAVDIGALERSLSDLAARTDPEAIAANREVNDRLFRSSHPDTLKTVEAWLAQHPRSGPAHAARTWIAINDVFLKGDPVHKPFGRPILNPYVPPWEDAKKAARRFADRGLVVDRDNVALLDAWLFIRQWPGEGGEIDRVAHRLMRAVPDRIGVKNILAAMVSNKWDATELIMSACVELGRKALDYDANTCIAESSIEDRISSAALKDIARDFVSASDDPRLDPLRLEIALYGQDRETEFERLAALHRSSLHRHNRLVNYLGHAHAVALRSDTPSYKATAEAEVLAHVTEWLVDDPLNYEYQIQLSAAFERQGDHEKALTSARAALVHGWMDPSAWYYSASAALSLGDYAAATDYFDGMGRASNADIGVLKSIHY